MKQSQDKGLEPLFNFIEDFVNNQIIRYIDSDYYFRFTVGDTSEALKHQEIIQSQLANGMTINEARQLNGLEKINKLSVDAICDIPGTPATVVQLVQFLQSSDEVSQQIQQHKNDIDPNKAKNGKPEDGMPVTAIDGKTKSDSPNPDGAKTLDSPNS